MPRKRSFPRRGADAPLPAPPPKGLRGQSPRSNQGAPMTEQRVPVEDRTRFLERKELKTARVLSLIGLVFLWELLARIGWVPRLFLPAPSAVVGEAVEMVASGELFRYLGSSLLRLRPGLAPRAPARGAAGLGGGVSRPG